MIYGIGTDLVEVDRLVKKLEKENSGNKLLRKIFCDNEIAYCEEVPARKAESYAARFAAKEAFFKALGTGWIEPMEFFEVEVCQNERGRPEILLHGETKKHFDKLGVKQVHLTLTHTSKMANAVVVLER